MTPLTADAGELEETMARSFTQTATLRNLLSRTGCPEIIRRCKSIFHKLINPRAAGSLYSDIIALTASSTDNDNDDGCDDENSSFDRKTTTTIPSDLLQALQLSIKTSSSKAQFLSRIYINGLSYSVTSSHVGSSCILSKSTTEKLVPSRINYIFRIMVGSKVCTYIATRGHLPFESDAQDPFRAYPALKAQLWSPKLGELHVFPANIIESHFASCPLIWGETDAVVVLSLSPVS
jgi:hypothetical protein